MTFHAYFQYVCLFIVWLCAISPTRMYAQKYRQQSDTHRTLLVVDKETGRPIEGAYILLENQPLASSTGGRIIIPWKTNSKDTVLVQSLGYKSQYIYLSEAFKKVNIQTVYRKRLLNYILCIRFFIEVHSIVSASRFFHMPTYLRVVIECQSRFFPFFPAFSRNCPDYFLHTSGSSSFRSLSDLGAR